MSRSDIAHLRLRNVMYKSQKNAFAYVELGIRAAHGHNRHPVHVVGYARVFKSLSGLEILWSTHPVRFCVLSRSKTWKNARRSRFSFPVVL